MADRLLVRATGRIVVVRVADIDWIEASGDYASLHVEKKTWLVRETIATIAQRYAIHGIVRIHRSTLVNLDRVTELRPMSNGEFVVVLRDATELKMSRNYRSALDSFVGN
jgi:two-component system LytT family response regulator